MFVEMNINSCTDNQYSNNKPQYKEQNNSNNTSVFELNNDKNTDESALDYLKSELEKENDEQGILGDIWNNFKSFVGIGLSSEKCEKAIEDYENGNISFNEAKDKISSFKTKQNTVIDMATNVAAGVGTSLILGSAVLSGGLSIGIVLAGAAIGAGIKAGLKFIDRATNEKQGDALDAKKIIKDGCSGGANGIITVSTLGLAPLAKEGAITVSTVAKESIKDTAIKGVVTGAELGAFAGGASGASNYTIEAAFEDDVDFNAGEMLETTVKSAGIGAFFGAILGGISSSAQYKQAEKIFLRRKEQFPELSDDVIVELSDQAAKLKNGYTAADQYKEDISDIFDDVPEAKISARVKGENSIFSKLANKFKNGKLTDITDENCYNAISDAYGARVQLQSLSNEETTDLINKYLQGTNFTYDDVVGYLEGSIDKTGVSDFDKLEAISKDILTSLKEKQTQDAVNSLINSINNAKEGEIMITELNNYGDEISSYFTKKQLNQIADAYFKKTGEKLTIVTKFDDSLAEFHENVMVGKGKYESVNAIWDTKGAIKDSGYASSQMNTLSIENESGNLIKGELQIRGVELNEFADAEHIPYDIRSGKIVASDTKYSEIFNLIKNMDSDTYNLYNNYLTKTYDWYRLEELGIKTTKPTMCQELINALGEKMSLLTDEGLKLLHNS